MILRCRFDPPADPASNMAADELLAEAMPAEGISMRFYGWQRTTLSLGAFQRIGDLADWPSLAGLPVVRRPSGGGAILHGTDLTYAIAVPRSHPWGGSARDLYDAVHGAMVGLLQRASLDARLVPDGPPSTGGLPEPFLCFDRRSPGDVVVGGCKVLGSAQRRLRTAVVQHGSLLLRRAMPDPLDTHGTVGGGRTGSGEPPRGSSTHPGIEDCLGRGVDVESLCRDWVTIVAKAAGLEPRWDPPAPAPPRGPWDAAVERYRDDRWTSRR